LRPRDDGVVAIAGAITGELLKSEVSVPDTHHAVDLLQSVAWSG
jgi:hypothetical protein